MSDTKERILLTALKRFAAEGYEGVSVSDIAGELGITKGALYRHYKNKRDIFESILRHMARRDAEQARDYTLPEGTRTEQPGAYREATIDQMVGFARTMFRYWTEDSFAAPFRKMLTLEQFRSPEMGRLYQQYLVSGPLQYMTDLFESVGIPGAGAAAARFYGPMFLMYSVYDGATDKARALSDMDSLLENAGKHLKGEKT